MATNPSFKQPQSVTEKKAEIYDLQQQLENLKLERAGIQYKIERHKEKMTQTHADLERLVEAWVDAIKGATSVLDDRV